MLRGRKTCTVEMLKSQGKGHLAPQFHARVPSQAERFVGREETWNVGHQNPSSLAK